MCDVDGDDDDDDDDDGDDDDDVVVAPPALNVPTLSSACRRPTIAWVLSAASPCRRADATIRLALGGRVGAGSKSDKRLSRG